SSTAAITTSTLAATSPLDDGTDANGNGDAIDNGNSAGDGELDEASTVFGPEDFEDFDVCRSMPEQMAGPYPSPELLLRRDITEDRDGVPLRVGAQLVDADCDPIPNAVLEIWHCDVDGDYSAYLDGETDDDAGPGTMFLRGY